MSTQSCYYQAQLEKKHHLFLVGALKYYDHVCFDRTLDIERGIFEFFVAPSQESTFLEIIERMQKKGMIQKFGTQIA